jgi:glycosyltransferase involved in cell wall biosynthesis
MGALNRRNGRPSVLFIGAVPPPTTGVTVVCKALLESKFAKLFDVTFINCVFIQSLADMGRFSVRKVSRAAQYFLRLIFILGTKHIDLVMQNHASVGWALLKDSVFAWVAASLFRRKVILWAHGNGILDFDQRGWLSRQIVAAGLRSAWCLVVPGERLKDSFVRWVEPERIRAISHGAPPVLGEPGGRAASAQANVTNVLFFSNLIREKGWLVTLEAARQVCRSKNDVRFIFCGAWWSSKDEQYARELVRSWKIEDRVEFRGLVLGEDKKRAFAESAIFLFPTFHPQETFGIVNLEAMQAGLPIVTTARGAIPEIVQDEVNGYLIPEQDAQALAQRIIHLADHPEIREAMGQRNRDKYMEQFTVEKFASRWIDLVTSAVSLAGPGDESGGSIYLR